MPQEKTDEKEWNTWDNLIIEDKIQKENIPFYQYSEFENVKLISGNVYKATFKISQKTIALKWVPLNDKFTLENLINEAKGHRKLEIHINILKSYGITKNANDYMIILEYVNEGSLQQYLRTNFQKLDWNVKLNLSKQIANVLMYLHSNEITHGKLNSENILVHNGSVKLKIFGIVNCLSESLKFPAIKYMDPQYLRIFYKNKSSDIFSLGIILWEISSGNPPFKMEYSSNVNLLNFVKEKREMVIPGTPSKYEETYTDCWKHNGTSRPDIFKVVKNLSEIIISNPSFENTTLQSQPYNFTDEVISVKSNIQNEEPKIKPGPPFFVDVSANINVFIKNLFEFFINLRCKQFQEMRLIMIKNYIREHKKNPVKILHEMIRHHLFTCLIGYFYEYGVGTPNDKQMAFKFYNLAANEIETSFSNSSSLRKLHEGNKEIGTISLAYMYLEGLGVEKNTKKAFQIFYKLAAKGSLTALGSVAYCYDEGFGVEKNEEKAFEIYLKSAEKGSLVAQTNVRSCYECGAGVAKDEAKGFQWITKSALSGNIDAMYNVGCYYCNGIGVGEDKKEAFKWFLKAAEKGFSMAQQSLGFCYKYGRAVDIDQKKAFEWFKKAAENDYSDSQYRLGSCFYDGYGTQVDIIKAVYWLNKAKENDNTDAEELLGEIIYLRIQIYDTRSLTSSTLGTMTKLTRSSTTTKARSKKGNNNNKQRKNHQSQPQEINYQQQQENNRQ
ncbi:hypothetical protein Glove_198g108 [Diversispora epigaea]|uniref:Protein kinase domain-containing protein n=1 Tax=Diversispora epigaea TaxID=1348612 RepID=A0A397IUS5_9GLOM|nr:hypothetical protein Glove_198g108 [Diversispora epigaea]